MFNESNDTEYTKKYCANHIKPDIEPNSCLYLSSFISISKCLLKTDFLAVWQWTESLCAGFLWGPSVLSHFKWGQRKPIFNRYSAYRLNTGKYLARDMQLFLYKFILSNCSDEQLIKLYKDKNMRTAVVISFALSVSYLLLKFHNILQ